MKQALILLCLLIAPSALAQGSAEGNVFAVALNFMAPRILDAIPAQQLALWGLHGLSTLDPALTPELANGQLRLRTDSQIVFTLPAPPPGDATAWGLAVGQAMSAAARLSDPVRQAGANGMIQAFFDEMFNHLDPYSRYVPPDDADGDRERRSGSAGIGVQLASRRVGRDHGVYIRAVFAEGPAADADLRVGDRILAIDGQDVRHLNLESVADRLAGEDGSAVRITVRGTDGKVDEVEATRATVPPETVFAGRQGDLLVIRITGFSRDTDHRLAHEIAHGLRGGGLHGLILDLRGNRGGLLRQAADAVSRVLDKGVIVITAGRDPQANHDFKADGGDMTNGLPIVVVVDGRSASAAEIMAAALADNRRAVVVGSSTLGKGLVQTIAPLPNGGELFVTWSRVLAPLGWPIQSLGVLPQICTSLGAEALAHQMNDLAHGVQDMAGAVARERAARAPLPPATALAIRSACPAAESSDADLQTARRLLDHPDLYSAALLSPVQPVPLSQGAVTP